jgi:hypothetical protein
MRVQKTFTVNTGAAVADEIVGAPFDVWHGQVSDVARQTGDNLQHHKIIVIEAATGATHVVQSSAIVSVRIDVLT